MALILIWKKALAAIFIASKYAKPLLKKCMPDAAKLLIAWACNILKKFISQVVLLCLSFKARPSIWIPTLQHLRQIKSHITLRNKGHNMRD